MLQAQDNVSSRVQNEIKITTSTTVLPMHLDHVTQFISQGSHDCDFQVIKEISK